MKHQELPEGTVTVLFTDVEGSTDLTTRRGDEAARAALRAHEELVRQQVQEHGGREVKAIGDGFMVAFASARRAVACAVGIQRAMEEWNAGVGAGPAPPEGAASSAPTEAIRVRIGLNTGEAIREEADLFGAAVNAAARICSKAEGGQILISEAAKAVMGRAKDVELVDRGRFRLRGFPERWRLYEVVWEQATAAAPAFVERTPFVGREVERAELRHLLDGAARGQGGLAMIGGEPGVGKTRLAEELMAEARQRGMTALIGRCYEMEGAPPYIPFVEMLEAAARTATPEGFRAALGDSAGEVARIMPELRRLFQDIPPPLELPPEQERHYLFNSLREFLARAGRAQPLLLVLDDLHWADDATLLLLQHIAQGLHEMPVLIVGTYRDVELDVARPLAKALRELLRQRLAHDLALKRLPEASVGAILGALSGQEPPAAVVEAVFSETEGNPFFVEEVFKHLAEERKLFDAEGHWLSGLSIGDLEVPRGVRLVIGQRLERVGEECRRVLTAAAVIGRGFSFELLEALGDPSTGSGQAVDADALLDAVDEAERARLIIAATDGREARFTFAHELIRQTLVSGLSLPRRQRMHLRIAEAIEQAYPHHIDERAADLAHHLYQAGTAADREKTVRYLTLAGDQAMEAAAFEDALGHFETALSLQPPADRSRHADLTYKRGLARRSLGRWDEALADWRDALAIYEGLGEAGAVGRISADITVQLAWAFRIVEALDISRRGLIALGERVSPDRCRLLAYAGLGLSMGGYYTAGEGMTAQALALAEQLGDARLLGTALTARAAHHWSYMQYRESVEAVLRAAASLRSAGDLWGLADALVFLQSGLACLGHVEDVVKIGEELESLAARLGHLGALIMAGRNRLVFELTVVRSLDRYEESCKSHLEVCQRAGAPWIFGCYTLLGLLDFWKGRWPEAAESFERGAEAEGLEDPGSSTGYHRAFLFLYRAYAGDRDYAVAALRQIRTYLPRAGQPNGWAPWTALLAAVEGLAVLGERDEASILYPMVLEAVETRALIRAFDGRFIQTVAGIAAAAGSQWEKAEEHFQTALRQAHETPVVIEPAEVRRWYARMLIDRDAPGDRDKAFRLLTEAIAMYKQIGMPKHVEMAQALLAEV